MNTASEKAIFAAGCFWGVEEKFRTTKGVIDTLVGYTGGHVENPTYEQVCGNATGHAEAVEVTFDPSLITYNELLSMFWDLHDPTTMNRQGPDVGTQYRSAIFYLNDEQKQTAEESKKNLDLSGKYSKPVVTEITKATMFYPAEEYHQKYILKTGRHACAI